MKGRQYDGAKAGGAWRTGTVNYLIGRPPDTQHLFQYAESRNVGSEPKPITSADVSGLTNVNGVDPNVLDGHLWAFLNLNLTGQAKEVFNNVTVMHGLEVWRRNLAYRHWSTRPSRPAHYRMPAPPSRVGRRTSGSSAKLGDPCQTYRDGTPS